MTNLNKGSGRSVTPSNMNKNGASREFLNKSIKNPVASNASFSSGFGVMRKSSISKSPSNYTKKINISKGGNDKSFEINVNKSFDKSREFNPKSTFKINSKSPVSTSRSNVKKQNFGNISISTNSSPIYRNKTNTTSNKSPDMMKQYNDIKNKNASPTIYTSFIKKKPNSMISNVKKITSQTSNQNNNNNNNQNQNNNLSNNSFNNNNKNSQNIEKKTVNSNMNSIDVSTNNTNGLNSNNHNFNVNNVNNASARNNNNNENDYFHQIQPKYE